MLYRVHDDLENDVGRVVRSGTVDSLKWLTPKSIGLLLEKGVISEVRAPPLSVLPGWERRATALEACGIETVGDLLEADLAEVSDELEVSEEALQGAVREARGLIEPT